MLDKAQIVIIGAGVIGASVAYHLARRGHCDILLLEKEPTEISGSTARSAAGVRHQFSSETNVRLSLYSIERLKHFYAEIGGHADLRQVGYLFLVNDPATWEQYRHNAAMQRALGVPVAELTPDEAARFVPGMRRDDLVGATYGAADGYCDPHGIALGYLQRARELGSRLRRETAVTGFVLRNGQVEALETSAGLIGCELVVNAAGAWAGQVAALAGLDLPVKPYRRTIFSTAPFPQIPKPLPLTVDVGSGFYMRSEGESLLIGRSNPAEPSSFNINVDWNWLDQVLEPGLQRFPILEEAALAEQQCWAGLYEITPDANPVLGRHPELASYYDASGFSGHGIMHAPATGMLLAEEIIDGRAHSINIDELRIERFRAEKTSAERNVI
jgi:sarcosine oxidase, subunit beta